MRIQHIREYARLAQTMSFTQTAREFSLTQPVLSKHISNIEQELGTQLIVRSQLGLSLTKAGEAFAEDAKTIVVEYDTALDNARQSRYLHTTTITIGYLAGASKRILPPAVVAFSQKHPDVTLRFVSLEVDEVLEALATDLIDFSITTSFKSNPHDADLFAWGPLYPDRVALLVPDTHPFASRESISVFDLQGETLLMTAPSFMTNDRSFIGLFDPIKEHVTFCQDAFDLESTLALMRTDSAPLQLTAVKPIFGIATS